MNLDPNPLSRGTAVPSSSFVKTFQEVVDCLFCAPVPANANGKGSLDNVFGCEGTTISSCTTCEMKGEFCADQPPHTEPSSGNLSIEELAIVRGYWRANRLSEEVLPCYNSEACLGGKTGTFDYCERGYEGPCKDTSE